MLDFEGTKLNYKPHPVQEILQKKNILFAFLLRKHVGKTLLNRLH